MGREVKRVALDFDHPVDTAWPGYVMPDYFNCDECQGAGCEWCGGEGIDPDCLDEYNNWEATDPPAGDGWQVWEDVTEGSPISPVFATRGELIDWLVRQGYTRTASEKFVENGHSFSFLMIPGVGIKRAIEYFDYWPVQKGR